MGTKTVRKGKDKNTTIHGKFNLAQQLKRDVAESVKKNKTPTGQWYFIPSQNMDVLIRKGNTLRKYLHRVLQGRHLKTRFEDKNNELSKRK